MTSSLHYLCGGLPLQPFPVNKGRNPDLPHAPKRSHRLSDQQQKQAIINALRYFPVDLHDKLRPEFEQELKDYGHIYMYRFKATMPNSDDLHWQAFLARNIHCASIMVQICNNLSVEIAQYPEELVTYGGNGQCLANWAQFWLIMQLLANLDLGETLVLNSSHPQGVYPSEYVSVDVMIPSDSREHWKELMQGFARQLVQPLHSPTRPLLQISNGLCVPNYSTGIHYSNYFALGVSNYGQMTAGSFCYIGPQGIVHGTTITLMSAAAQYRAKYGNPSGNKNDERMQQFEVEAFAIKQVQYPFPSDHIVQEECKKEPKCQDSEPLVYLSSGLGGMSGAQTKAGLIAGVISVIAEVRPEPIMKRFNQKWVDEIISDLDILIKRIRCLRKNRQVSSIAFFGNVVEVWERLADLHNKGELLINLASDQTSCHDIQNGGYIPVGVSLNDLNDLITERPDEFQRQVQSSLRRQVQAINRITQQSPVIFWDYGNAFLLESLRAGADLIANQQLSDEIDSKSIDQFSIVNLKLRYESYIESIMGNIFSLGFGPFRWICSSNKQEDLSLTDRLAAEVMQSELNNCTIEINESTESIDGEQLKLLRDRHQQLQNNLDWIRQADQHRLVVGCKSRILYADRRARERIALAFNQAIREGKLNGPIVLSRDHHDVSSVDSPFRETSNITDGSKFTADMAIQNALGLSARGVTWVAIHNGGGVGFGESINGGFGLVLDGTESCANSIQLIMNWDVNNGVSRRAWAGNRNAIGTIQQEVQVGKVKCLVPSFEKR